MLTGEVPAKHWETDAMRWKWTERQLYELGALVRGMVQTHSGMGSRVGACECRHRKTYG